MNVQDYVHKAAKVQAWVHEGEEPDPSTGAKRGQVVVRHENDFLEVLDAEVFRDRYEEPPLYTLGPVKMAVGNTRLVGALKVFMGYPEGVANAMTEYAQANPTHMFVDREVIPLGADRILVFALVDRIGREDDARYKRELELQERVRKLMEEEREEKTRAFPAVHEAATKMAREQREKFQAEQRELRELAEQGKKCRANHGKAGKGKKS